MSTGIDAEKWAVEYDAEQRKRELRRRAAWDGRICGGCGRNLTRNEAVYRDRCNPRDEVQGGATPTCVGCIDSLYKNSSDWFHLVGPCDACGRPVFEETFRSKRWAFCSYRCRKVVEDRQQIERRRVRHQPITCASCQKEFTPRRRDAITCGNSCRQRLHRLRHREACVTDVTLEEICAKGFIRYA
jgi:endogenous inhibitor of DNA gyrase (YacG/DUF329 family)